MKKVISWFLVMTLMLSMFAVPAYATGSEDIKADIVLTEGTHNGRNGLFVEFGIQTGTTGISAIAYAIAYDPAILELVDASGTSVTVPTSDYSLVKESMIEHNLAGFDAAFSNVYLLGIGSAVGMVFFRGSMTDMPFATWTLLDKCFLAYRTGKDASDITKNAIRMATVAEADKLGQSSVVFATCGADNYGVGFCDGTADTAGWEANLSFGKDFAFAKPALPSSASVSIGGTPKIGEPLTATPSGLPSDAGTLTYKWYRDGETSPISGADTGTYTPSVAEDVDKQIKVEVSAANYSGSVTDTTAATVEKADGPAAPTGLAVVSVTDTTITVTPDAAWEYSKNDGGTWQDSNVFTGLVPNNYYSQIVARVKETGTHKAGAKSATVSATTAKGSADAETITKLKATHTPYTGTYDGTAHDAFSVDAAALGALTGWSVTYSTNGTSYGSAMPKVTNVADSGKIYVKFANTSYADVIAEYDVTVSAKDIDGVNIVFGTQATYDGNSHTAIYTVTDGTYTLVKGTDYTVRTNTDTATDVQSMYLYIDGIGNYKDAKSGGWSLQRATPTATDFDTSGLAASYSYNGSEQTAPVPTTAKTGMGTVTVNYPGGNTPKFVGDYNLQFSVAEGQNYNEAGPFTYGTMKIVAADQNPTFTTPVDLAKGGHMLDLRTLVSGAKGDMIFTIASGTAATLSGYTLTSTGITGAVTIKVSITAKDVNSDGKNEYNAFNKSDAITVNVIDKTSDTTTMKVSQGDITYGGSVSPSVTNKPAGTGTVSYTYEGRDGTTYSSSATAPTNVGKYKVTAKCESSTVIYTAEDTFEILPKSISGMTVSLDKTSLEYNGSAQTVNVTVKDGSTTLIKGTDYTVTGVTSGTNVGSYTVTVIGNGNYNGSVDRTWKITAKDVKLTGGINATDRSYVKDNKTVDLTKGTLTFDGLVSGETLDVNIPATGTISDAKVGAYNVTYSGVTLADGTGKASNYKLVSPLPTVTVNITKATAPTLADIAVSQKYTVTTEQSKDIGNGGMPADAGTLTYSEGAPALLTGSVAIDSASLDATTGKVTYKLSGGAAGDTVTLPVIIESANYADATVNVVITLTAKDDQATLTLTGETTVVYGQTLQLGTSGGNGNGAVTYAVTNGTGEATIDATGKLTPVKVGTVKVKATKAEDTNYNAITSAEVEITIKQATSTGEPKYTAITTSGKTLADAGLTTTGSTLNPNAGTLVWVDNAGNVLPGTTTVEANTTYKWRFTPADANYTTLTGSIELYHKSTSSGGGGSYYAPVVPDMPMLYRGCTGDAVKTLQDKLNTLGYNSGNVDGIFGAKTYAAVTAFQKANGLGVDGIVGKLTWGKLYGVSPAMPVETTTVVGRPTVSYGSRGDAVRKLQELLNALGYDCGSVDGIFGSKTKAAVLAFQKANGLGADGIVGPLTWAKLG